MDDLDRFRKREKLLLGWKKVVQSVSEEELEENVVQFSYNLATLLDSESPSNTGFICGKFWRPYAKCLENSFRQESLHTCRNGPSVGLLMKLMGVEVISRIAGVENLQWSANLINTSLVEWWGATLMNVSLGASSSRRVSRSISGGSRDDSIIDDASREPARDVPGAGSAITRGAGIRRGERTPRKLVFSTTITVEHGTGRPPLGSISSAPLLSSREEYGHQMRTYVDLLNERGLLTNSAGGMGRVGSSLVEELVDWSTYDVIQQGVRPWKTLKLVHPVLRFFFNVVSHVKVLEVGKTTGFLSDVRLVDDISCAVHHLLVSFRAMFVDHFGRLNKLNRTMCAILLSELHEYNVMESDSMEMVKEDLKGLNRVVSEWNTQRIDVDSSYGYHSPIRVRDAPEFDRRNVGFIGDKFLIISDIICNVHMRLGDRRETSVFEKMNQDVFGPWKDGLMAVLKEVPRIENRLRTLFGQLVSFISEWSLVHAASPLVQANVALLVIEIAKKRLRSFFPLCLRCLDWCHTVGTRTDSPLSRICDTKFIRSITVEMREMLLQKLMQIMVKGSCSQRDARYIYALLEIDDRLVLARILQHLALTLCWYDAQMRPLMTSNDPLKSVLSDTMISSPVAKGHVLESFPTKLQHLLVLYARSKEVSKQGGERGRYTDGDVAIASLLHLATVFVSNSKSAFTLFPQGEEDAVLKTLISYFSISSVRMASGAVIRRLLLSEDAHIQLLMLTKALEYATSPCKDREEVISRVSMLRILIFCLGSNANLRFIAYRHEDLEEHIGKVVTDFTQCPQIGDDGVLTTFICGRIRLLTCIIDPKELTRFRGVGSMVISSMMKLVNILKSPVFCSSVIYELVRLSVLDSSVPEELLFAINDADFVVKDTDVFVRSRTSEPSALSSGQDGESSTTIASAPAKALAISSSPSSSLSESKEVSVLDIGGFMDEWIGDWMELLKEHAFGQFFEEMPKEHFSENRVVSVFDEMFEGLVNLIANQLIESLLRSKESEGYVVWMLVAFRRIVLSSLDAMDHIARTPFLRALISSFHRFELIGKSVISPLMELVQVVSSHSLSLENMLQLFRLLRPVRFSTNLMDCLIQSVESGWRSPNFIIDLGGDNYLPVPFGTIRREKAHVISYVVEFPPDVGFSLTLWFRLEVLPALNGTQERCLISCRSNGRESLRCTVDHENVIRCGGSSFKTEAIVGDASQCIQYGKWHHLCLNIIRGTTSSVYIDGKCVANGSIRVDKRGYLENLLIGKLDHEENGKILESKLGLAVGNIHYFDLPLDDGEIYLMSCVSPNYYGDFMNQVATRLLTPDVACRDSLERFVNPSLRDMISRSVAPISDKLKFYYVAKEYIVYFRSTAPPPFTTSPLRASPRRPDRSDRMWFVPEQRKVETRRIFRWCLWDSVYRIDGISSILTLAARVKDTKRLCQVMHLITALLRYNRGNFSAFRKGHGYGIIGGALRRLGPQLGEGVVSMVGAMSGLLHDKCVSDADVLPRILMDFSIWTRTSVKVQEHWIQFVRELLDDRVHGKVVQEYHKQICEEYDILALMTSTLRRFITEFHGSVFPVMVQFFSQLLWYSAQRQKQSQVMSKQMSGDDVSARERGSGGGNDSENGVGNGGGGGSGSEENGGDEIPRMRNFKNLAFLTMWLHREGLLMDCHKNVFSLHVCLLHELFNQVSKLPQEKKNDFFSTFCSDFWYCQMESTNHLVRDAALRMTLLPVATNCMKSNECSVLLTAIGTLVRDVGSISMEEVDTLSRFSLSMSMEDIAPGCNGFSCRHDDEGESHVGDGFFPESSAFSSSPPPISSSNAGICCEDMLVVLRVLGQTLCVANSHELALTIVDRMACLVKESSQLFIHAKQMTLLSLLDCVFASVVDVDLERWHVIRIHVTRGIVHPICAYLIGHKSFRTCLLVAYAAAQWGRLGKFNDMVWIFRNELLLLLLRSTSVPAGGKRILMENEVYLLRLVCMHLRWRLTENPRHLQDGWDEEKLDESRCLEKSLLSELGNFVNDFDSKLALEYVALLLVCRQPPLDEVGAGELLDYLNERVSTVADDVACFIFHELWPGLKSKKTMVSLEGNGDGENSHASIGGSSSDVVDKEKRKLSDLWKQCADVIISEKPNVARMFVIRSISSGDGNGGAKVEEEAASIWQAHSSLPERCYDLASKRKWSLEKELLDRELMFRRDCEVSRERLDEHKNVAEKVLRSGRKCVEETDTKTPPMTQIEEIMRKEDVMTRIKFEKMVESLTNEQSVWTLVDICDRKVRCFEMERFDKYLPSGDDPLFLELVAYSRDPLHVIQHMQPFLQRKKAVVVMYGSRSHSRDAWTDSPISPQPSQMVEWKLQCVEAHKTMTSFVIDIVSEHTNDGEFICPATRIAPAFTEEGFIHVTKKHLYFRPKYESLDVRSHFSTKNPVFDELRLIIGDRGELVELEPYHERRADITLSMIEEVRRTQERRISIFTRRGKDVLFAFSSFEDIQRFVEEMKKLNAFPERHLKPRYFERKWENGEITSFEYLMELNLLAGRSLNDTDLYPIFPVILAMSEDGEGELLNPSSPHAYRDLSRPSGVLSGKKEEWALELYESVGRHHNQLPISRAIVYQYLIRLEPYGHLFHTFNKGWDPTRSFESFPDIWKQLIESRGRTNELTPEFFYHSDFLVNHNRIPTSSGVSLPSWAKGDPRRFVRIHRQILESEHVSRKLNEWIDLVFGCASRGDDAREKLNLHLESAYDDAALESPIHDESFVLGKMPLCLFSHPHHSRRRMPRISPFFRPSNTSALSTESFLDAPDSEFSCPDSIPRDIVIPTERTLGMLQPPLLVPGKIVMGSYIARSLRITKDGKIESLMDRRAWIWKDKSWSIDWKGCDSHFQVREAEREQPTFQFEMMHVDWPLPGLVMYDGSLVAIGGESGVVQLYSVSWSDGDVKARLSDVLVGHTEAVIALTACEEFHLLVSSSRDALAIVWDMGRISMRYVLQHGEHREVKCIAVSRTTGEVVTYATNPATGESIVTLWSVNGHLLERIQLDPLHPRVTCMLISHAEEGIHENAVFLGLENGTILMLSMFDLSRMCDVISCRLDDSDGSAITAMALSEDLQYFAASDESKRSVLFTPRLKRAGRKLRKQQTN
eukprot:TRINITY_DN1120_c0_g2_i1.p1 TRINITY_DN1120_c0_g2~~TRINITY_DN1120_c0_g2_i1.p1  ORF type:complete len:3116 (-),score=749.97 TRINITY_DN1120_c0_g2_i1:116-9463(-)